MAKRGGANKPSVLRWILFGSIPLVVFALAFALGAFEHDELIPIDDVYVIDDDTLLVAGVSGQDSDVDSRRHSRLALLELDGTMHTVVRQQGPLEVIGVADGVVWLRDREHGLHARTLPGLALVEGIGAAVKGHPALSTRAQPKGFTEDFLVALGSDAREYRVGLDGSIERAPADEAATPKKQRRPTEAATMPVAEVRALQKRLQHNERLTKPSLLSGQRTPGPVMLSDPPSVLATSFEPVVGGTSQALHRVTTEGELVWSTTASQLADAIELEGQIILLEWVGVRDGTVLALVELTEFSQDDQGDDYSQHMQQLVEIDAKTGVVRSSHPVREPEGS